MGALFLTKEARIYNGAKIASSINGAGKTGQLRVKEWNLDHFLTPYTKINSKWIKDLNVRPETIKLLEENIGRTLDDINQNKILYDPPPRVTEIKAKVNKWDLIKLKKLLHSKGNYKQGEKTALRLGENNSKWNNWQLISKIYKQLTQLNTRKKKNRKVWKRPIQTFLQKRYTDG